MSNTGPAIKSGEQTTEYAEVQKSNWWSTVVAVAGGLALVIPGVIDALQPVAATKTGMIVLQVLGGLMTVIGIITKGVTAASYAQGRSLVKAAAARDVPPPPQV